MNVGERKCGKNAVKNKLENQIHLKQPPNEIGNP